jgi:hypothetical protein
MQPLFTKLNALISQVYPDYSANSNLMRGSVVKLTIGDYIYRMPGFIQNVDVTIDNSNTPWEIQLYGPEVESDVAQLPHLVSVGVTFLPIMDILPRRVTSKNPNVPLIANNNTSFLNSYIDYTTKPKNTESTTISNVVNSTDPLTNQVNAQNDAIDANAALSNTSTGKKQKFKNNLVAQVARRTRAARLEDRKIARDRLAGLSTPAVNANFRI